MKVGIAQWCISDDVEEAIAQASQLGLETLHVGPDQTFIDRLLDDMESQQRFVQLCRNRDMTIMGLACNVADEQPLWELQSYLLQVIDLAAVLQVPLVYVPSFESSEITDRVSMGLTAETLRDCCRYVGSRNITIASENSLGVADNLELVKRVDDSRFRIMLDTYNPIIWGHQPHALVAELWPFLCSQIHAKDGVNNRMGSARLGEGDADLATTLALLRELGFDGTIILENEYDSAAIRQQIELDNGFIKRVFERNGV